MGEPAYITREQLLAAGEIHTTSLRAAQIDRLVHSASRDIDISFHRHFYPRIETVTYEPGRVEAALWLNRDLLELTAAVVDDVPVADVSEVELYPPEYGPPFSRVGLSGAKVELSGVWGYSDDETPAATLAAAVADTTAVEVVVSDAAKVGAGDLLRVDSERMIVERRRLEDTGVDLASPLTADVSDDLVAVTSGAGINPGELVTVDSERILVVDVAGDNLITKRAADGSTLASHSTGADIYTARRLVVERGAAGTTAATHLTSAPVRRHQAPTPIRTLCLAEALTSLHQETSGYGRVIGGGEAQMEARGLGLADARSKAETYKRMRMAAV